MTRYRDQRRRLRALEGLRFGPDAPPPYVTVGEDGQLYTPAGERYTGAAPVKGYDGVSPDDWDAPAEGPGRQ